MKKGYVGIIFFLALGFSAGGQTNQWTKPTSGNWEESYWSLGQLPGIDQQWVSLNNYGSKVVVIGSNTVANFPESLSLNNLLIDAPSNSLNTLLLDGASLNVHSNLVIGTNGSLASRYSALRAANVFIDGRATFSDNASEDFGELTLRFGMALGLTNGTFNCSTLNAYTAGLTQSGGLFVVDTINIPDMRDVTIGTSGTYYLQDGTLISQNVNLGGGSLGANSRYPQILQSGGVHTNASMNLASWTNSAWGRYDLNGGVLVSTSVLLNGVFSQSRGTNIIHDLECSGEYELYGGELVTDNAAVKGTIGGYLYQGGGNHTVLGKLLILGLPYPDYYYSYDLRSGNLTAANVEIRGGSLIVSTTALFSVTGTLTVSAGGSLIGGGVYAVQNLGQLQNSGGDLYLHDNSTLSTNATTWHFADSHTVPWAGRLRIFRWLSNPGDHIYFGADSHSLTAQQLAQIVFVGTDAEYPAILLPTGELVPNMITNHWTKPTSGNWEEAYWSLGRLPAMDQGFASIDNAGWKALAIGQNTTANFPQSLSVNSVLIGGPTNSFNTLLLNWAGLNVPLFIKLDLIVATNGALDSHYSALHADKAYIAGSASFSDYATEDFGQMWIRSVAALNLVNGIMTCSNLTFDQGTFTQSGGTHAVQNIQLPEFSAANTWGQPPTAYYLQGGTLTSGQLTFGDSGWIQGYYYPADVSGTFRQTGGIHTNSVMTFRSDFMGNSPLGTYYLDGGMLVSAFVINGNFYQSGGTNIVQEYSGKSYQLSGGHLVISNLSILGYPWNGADQSGGTNTVTHLLQIFGRYTVAGGRLLATNIDLTGLLNVCSNGYLAAANLQIDQGELNLSSQGAVSNRGILVLAGSITASNSTTASYLGQLQISAVSTFDLHSRSNQQTDATLWRFADSRALPWTGPLQITNWGRVSGDHIFVGTNTDGLTATQLAQITFLWNEANFPAKLLPTGELVANAATNRWTKSGDGNWEESSYWSLGRLPGMDQGFVIFDNPGSKHLSISQNTAANYPDSLSLQNLSLGGPTNSVNQLLLNSAGLTVPLVVQRDLRIGSGARLDSHYSALQAPSAYIDGTTSFSDNSTANFGQLSLRPGAVFGLTNAIMTCSNLTFDQATFIQNGGTHVVQNITLPRERSESGPGTLSSSYSLSGGILVSSNFSLGFQTNFDSSYNLGTPSDAGTFLQTTGIHTNLNLYLRDWNLLPWLERYGSYHLDGGLLVSSYLSDNGEFIQNGGTNIVQTLGVGRHYHLNAGLLVTTNTSVGWSNANFIQFGGTHIIQDTLRVSGTYDLGAYELAGGTLITTNIYLSAGNLRLSSHGIVSSNATITFYEGRLSANNINDPQHFGKVSVSGFGSIDMHYFSAGNPANPTVLRFDDSHAMTWYGQFLITNWGLNGGDHIYFGTDDKGLNTNQVSQIKFKVKNLNLPAKLLATGEVVPILPTLGFTNVNNILVLSWPGNGYELVSSTNINGPFSPVAGAASPFTNTFTDPQRFFRLHLPSP